jgi:hypothetical protein
MYLLGIRERLRKVESIVTTKHGQEDDILMNTIVTKQLTEFGYS